MPRPSGPRIEINRRRLVRLYRKGHTLAELAPMFEVSEATIRRRLLAAKVKLRKSGRRVAPSDARTVAALYESGRTMDQVADVLGISKATVLRRLRSVGVPSRKQHGRRRFIDVEWCLEMREQGHTLKEIAGWLGVSTATVSQRLREAREQQAEAADAGAATPAEGEPPAD